VIDDYRFKSFEESLGEALISGNKKQRKPFVKKNVKVLL
jgi:hypothetical protein